MIKFVIEGAPYGKGRPRFTRSGHTYTPGKTAQYERIVQYAYKSQALGRRLNGPIEATIYAQFGPIKSDSKKTWAAKLAGLFLPTKKPDCDNIAKTVLDALNGVAYDDDCQVIALHVYKLYGDTPQVFVSLREVENADDLMPIPAYSS